MDVEEALLGPGGAGGGRSQRGEGGREGSDVRVECASRCT